jgi:ABC-type arginine transport system permease subunit
MENINKLTEMITRGGVAAVLLVIVLYFGNTFIISMTEMQKELATIRVEIQKLQDSVITTATVEKMIDEKIKLL